MLKANQIIVVSQGVFTDFKIYDRERKKCECSFNQSKLFMGGENTLKILKGESEETITYIALRSSCSTDIRFAISKEFDIPRRKLEELIQNKHEMNHARDVLMEMLGIKIEPQIDKKLDKNYGKKKPVIRRKKKSS